MPENMIMGATNAGTVWGGGVGCRVCGVWLRDEMVVVVVVVHG
jgi:hypothetical protein